MAEQLTQIGREIYVDMLVRENMPRRLDRGRLRLKSAQTHLSAFAGFAIEVLRYRKNDSEESAKEYFKQRQEIRQELCEQRLQRFVIEKCLGTDNLRQAILTANLDEDQPAKVIRALNLAEIGGYMPMMELDDATQRKVYEAAGEELNFAYRLTGEFPQEGDFLVGLGDKDNTQVAFSYGVQD